MDCVLARPSPVRFHGAGWRFPWSTMQPCRARTSGLGVTPLLLARCVGCVSPVRRTHGVWFVVSRPSAALGARVCAVSTVPWRLFTGCAPSVFLCAVSVATWRLFTGVRAWSVLCAVSLATWLVFTGVPPRCVVSRVRCPWQLSSSSPVSSSVCCACGVLGNLAPVHQSARLVCCVACAVSLATWLLFTGLQARCAVCAVSMAARVLFAGVPARCVVPLVRCPWPLGSCSAVCPLYVFCCVYGAPCHLPPVHRRKGFWFAHTCASSLYLF